jgi:hypothetical protein
LWTPLGPGASSFAEQKALLGTVAGWLPTGTDELLLGDREFGTGILALALVYTRLLLWGAYVIASGQQKLVDNVRKPTLSLFQTGLRFVMRMWQRGQLRQFHWHLSILTVVDN